MKKCNFEQNTIKVPQGNAWQLLLPLSTAKWRGQDLVTESIDYRALEDIAVFIDGEEWDYTLQENGILCDIPADMPLGPHNTVITAAYFGVEVKASYFENFTIVQWSFESNVGEHLQDSPLISSPAYIYVGEPCCLASRNRIAVLLLQRLQLLIIRDAYVDISR